MTYLRKCIASVLRETKNIEFEIIVIDSGSFDGSEAMLRRDYPQVRFLQSEHNVGFSRANNLAFNISTGRNVLFLNPDTELVGPAVNVIYAALQELPDPGVVGGKLLNSDGTLQTSCVKAFPNLINQFLDADVLRNLFQRARLWGMRPLFETSEKPAEVDVISGACMMMRRTVFENIGRFNTQYFVYSEDVDVCLRAKLAGFKNYYVPSAIIVHHGGGCTGETEKSTFSSVMMLESRWRYFLATRPKWYGWVYRMSMSVISILRIGLILVAWAGKRAGARMALEKWWARLRWSFGLESWVKLYKL